jgi:hypothetical protein
MLTTQIIDKLIEFETDAKPADFAKAFGGSLGAHLWDKFAYQYEHNLLQMCRYLDNKNLAALTNYLNNWRIE